MAEEDASNFPENSAETELGSELYQQHQLPNTSAIITVNVGGILFSTLSANLQKVRAA